MGSAPPKANKQSANTRDEPEARTGAQKLEIENVEQYERHRMVSPAPDKARKKRKVPNPADNPPYEKPYGPTKNDRSTP